MMFIGRYRWGFRRKYDAIYHLIHVDHHSDYSKNMYIQCTFPHIYSVNPPPVARVSARRIVLLQYPTGFSVATF